MYNKFIAKYIIQDMKKGKRFMALFNFKKFIYKRKDHSLGTV